jgi:flagellar M-ring protein FliF
MQYLRPFIGVVQQLGPKRLSLLGLVGAVIFTLLLVGTYYLNRPVREVVYTGLDTEDVNRIGAALSEVGIAYDVSVSGDAVLVDFGRTAEARMILAEKGLPKSEKSGYELFDQMGSLGLTSFMQQVTRVRALEGELSRTIQQLQGIRSARVHLGLKNEGTFRSKTEQPSASVVIKPDGTAKESLAASVRHIVAAAIPGLNAEQVTVMTTDGQILVTGGDPEGSEPYRKLELEQKIANETRLSAERTLSAIVGPNNLRVSVTAQLNSDRRQITETQFDPESKVERSLRTVKEMDENNNSSGSNSVSVAQNIPQEATQPAAGETAKERKERKEETANYELNSKQTATESVGYSVEKLSMAVLLNKQALLKAQGATPDEAKLTQQISDIEGLVKSAIGFDEKRGDTVRVWAADFVEEELAPVPDSSSGFVATLQGNLGTIINALALLTGFILVILLGLRPTVKAILASGTPLQVDGPSDPMTAIAAKDGFAGSEDQLLLGSQPMNAKDKLNKAVEIDVDRAAHVLKQWVGKQKQSAT